MAGISPNIAALSIVTMASADSVRPPSTISVGARNIGRADRARQRDPEPRESHAERARRALRAPRSPQQVRNDPRAGRAERGANRQLAPAAGHARENRFEALTHAIEPHERDCGDREPRERTELARRGTSSGPSRPRSPARPGTTTARAEKCAG